MSEDSVVSPTGKQHWKREKGVENPPLGQEVILPPDRSSRPLDVKLELYEGPLDLLLEIIRRSEMNIFDIPMVEVTDQYLAYLNHMRLLDLEVAGEFLVMAATLIYIK